MGGRCFGDVTSTGAGKGYPFVYTPFTPGTCIDQLLSTEYGTQVATLEQPFILIYLERIISFIPGKIIDVLTVEII